MREMQWAIRPEYLRSVRNASPMMRAQAPRSNLAEQFDTNSQPDLGFSGHAGMKSRRGDRSNFRPTTRRFVTFSQVRNSTGGARSSHSMRS